MDHPLRRPEEILAYRSLKQILAAKPRSLWTAGPRDSALTAMRLMTEKNIGLVVVTEYGRSPAFYPNATAFGSSCLPGSLRNSLQ
jgi:hypothetical protein